MKLKHDKISDKRISTSFLFIPLRIDNESRWFETATYEEEWQKVCSDPIMYNWVPIKWIDIK